MAACFDRPGFMHRNMSRSRRNNALIGAQHGSYDRRIRLRPADEEVYLRVRFAAGGAYLFLCTLAYRVRAVAGILIHVYLTEPPENIRVAAFHVIT